MSLERGTIPDALSARDQWICWRNECRECSTVYPPETKVCPDCDEENTKRPIDASSGEWAKTNDPSTWVDFDTAVQYNEQNDTHGVGFVFSPDDDIAGVDLDDCRDPETGDIEDWARDIVIALGSFTEVSPSGTGLHIYVYGELPEDGNRRDNVEMYDRERYFTVTGDEIPHSPGSINYREEELVAVHEDKIQRSSVAGSRHSEIVDFTLDVDLTEDVEQFTNDLGRSLEEIRDQDPKLDALLDELDPDGYDYESTSEADFATAAKLWQWRFGRQDIAKIIHQYRTREKTLRPDYHELTISKAATGEQYDPRPSDYTVEVLDNRETYHSINDVEPPQRNYVLAKPPRAGGSYASMKWLSNRPLTVLVSRHTIGEHHLDILSDVMPEGCCAVHLVGSYRACESSGQDCPRRSENHDDHSQLQMRAVEAVHNNRTITVEDCPETFCRHEFLRECARIAHAMVTVPELMPNIDREFDAMNLLIDEEQALDHYRPDSVALAEIEKVFEPDGTPNVQVTDSALDDQFWALEEIVQRIEEDQDERAEEAEEEGRDWRRKSQEIDIENAVEYLQEVREILGVSDLVTDMIERDDEYPSTDEVLDEMIERLEEIPRPRPHTRAEDFRDALSEYTARYYRNDSVDPGSLIEAVLFPYHDKPFDFKHAGSGHRLRLIGGRQVFEADTLIEYDQIGVIAGLEGEMFFDDLGLPATVIEIDHFRYEDDFVVVPVAKESEESDRDLEPTNRQRSRVRRVSQLLNEQNHPHLAVTGTKNRAESHHSCLDSGMADIISNPEHPILDLYKLWTVGQTGIIYANSSVSRGIDAPFFDISVVASSEFATPYWEARRKYERQTEGEDTGRTAAIEGELKARELTNAVLRPSATPTIEEHYGTKFIVCSEWDAKRLMYLDDGSVPTMGDEEEVAAMISQLTVGGPLSETVDAVFEELGENEQDFIEVATTEEFTEEKHSRPSFEKGTLASWVEDGYLTRGDECKSIAGLVDDAGGIKLADLKDRVPFEGGRVSAVTKTLERKGVITKETLDTDGRGRPPVEYRR